ncbi:MAG: calcium-binding protein [Yoonia sp.]
MTNMSSAPLVVTGIQVPVYQMTSDMFGAIGVNNYGYHFFEEHTDLLGLTNVRFPGGTVSEHGYVADGRIRLGVGEISLETLEGDRSHFAFDLTHPELMSPLALEYDENNFLNRDDVGTLSQAMALAVERDVTLGIIIPVERYFSGADFTDADVRARAIEIAKSDVTVFLDRLKAGAFNNGVYPKTITFDIGNEAYANPIEYAVIAKAMIEEISQSLADSDINFEIAFQMGRGSYEFVNLFEAGYFTPFFDGSGNPIEGLDELGSAPNANMPYLDRQIAIDEMMIGILGDTIVHIDVVRHHVLSFNSHTYANSESALHQRDLIFDHWVAKFAEHGISREEIAYYVSAWSTNSSDGGSMPYELSAAANTVELFAYFMEAGVDRAAVWGVVGSFRYNDDMATTTVTDRLSDYLSPQAAIIQLMSENIMDSAFLGSSGVISSEYSTYTYENDINYTIFFVAGDIGSDELSVDVDLGLFGDLQFVSVVNLDIESGEQSGASSISHEEASVTDGMATITFDQSHEIVMVTLDKNESLVFHTVEAIEEITGEAIASSATLHSAIGSEEDDTLSGGSGTDIIYGGSGNDRLDGGGGRSTFLGGDATFDDQFAKLGNNNGDFIFGGDGDDIIYGYAGNDLLSGDAGDDDLWGGSGFDTFVFISGNDTIHDFASGVDTLAISEALLDGLSLEIWLQSAAKITEDGVLLASLTGVSMMLHGIDDPQDLLLDIQIFDDVDVFQF